MIYKKIIFWAAIILVGSALFIFYAKDVQKRFKNFQPPSFNKPELKMPEIPDLLQDVRQSTTTE